MNKSTAPILVSHEEANQEDNIFKKVKELELSLPRKKWIGSTYLYLYQNFWVPSLFLSGVVSFEETFRARDSDILLISMPKSGTTWLQALSFAILNRETYPISNNQDPACKPHPLLSHNPQQLAPIWEIVMSRTLKTNLPNDLLESHHHHHHPSRLFSTHLPYNALPDSIKTSGCQIVYICRNILDTVISFWHFSRQIKAAMSGDEGDSMSLEDYVDSVCSGVGSYGPYWDHVLGYWQESLKRPEKVLFVKYEDIKGDQISEMKRLAEFMRCPFTLEEEERGVIEEIVQLCSIGNLKELEVNKTGRRDSNLPVKHSALFRKGEVGDWMNHMTPSMADHLLKVMEDKFHGSGLTFKTIIN